MNVVTEVHSTHTYLVCMSKCAYLYSVYYVASYPYWTVWERQAFSEPRYLRALVFDTAPLVADRNGSNQATSQHCQHVYMGCVVLCCNIHHWIPSTISWGGREVWGREREREGLRQYTIWTTVLHVHHHCSSFRFISIDQLGTLSGWETWCYVVSRHNRSVELCVVWSVLIMSTRSFLPDLDTSAPLPQDNS